MKTEFEKILFETGIEQKEILKVLFYLKRDEYQKGLNVGEPNKADVSRTVRGINNLTVASAFRYVEALNICLKNKGINKQVTIDELFKR
jgi:hypothetical protein